MGYMMGLGTAAGRKWAGGGEEDETLVPGRGCRQVQG